MKILQLTLEIKLPDVFTLDKNERKWMENEILVTDSKLMLYSSELGDEIGEIIKVSHIQWLSDKDRTQLNGVSRKSEKE